MRKIYLLLLFFIPAISFSQLLIKGISPSFYVMHNVSANETYASIAKLYNTTSAQIANYNKLTLHNGKVFARTLQIPLTSKNFIQKSSASEKETLVPVNYILNTNETVTEVLARFKLSVESLKKINNISEEELNSHKQLIIGFLRIKPEAASFFGVEKKIVETTGIIEETQRGKVEPKDTLSIEQKTADGVRASKSRTDDKPVQEIVPGSKPDTVGTAPFANTTEQASLPQSNRLKVIIDCNNTWCDYTFIRTEINIVDFLLDRVASDVHILITSQQNGNGGSQFQMIFYGQNKFKNLKDTLQFNLDPNATDFERRDAMIKYIKIGLIPFIAKTEYAGDINIQMKKDVLSKDATSNANTKDKWNYWVFRAGSSGSMNFEQLYKYTNYSGNVSANRITDKIKIGFSSNGWRNVQKYSDTTGTITDIIKNSNYNFQHYLVKSLGDNWSVGYESSFNKNTYSNNKSRLYFAAGIEYAIFPYKEVNNRFFTIGYSVNARKNKYYEVTIYDKTEEVLLEHELAANISVKQKWGSINSQVEYSNYLHDFKQNNFSVDLSVDVRITGGLSVYGYISTALVHDQVYLPKSGATSFDILTRRRQLASSYTFSSSFGLSYRFGSMLNNFVNPRFNNGN